MQYRLLRRLSIGLSFLALLNSSYLFYSHFKNYTDISFQSFCAVTKAINCDTVAQSPWSFLWGLPVSLWGALFFVCLLFLFASPLFTRNKQERGWAFLFFVSLLAIIFASYLAFISAYKIKSFCILCILSYALSLLIFYLAYKSLQLFSAESFFINLKNDIIIIIKSVRIKLFFLFATIVIIVIYICMPRYWLAQSSASYKNLKRGIEEYSGNPWIGAEKPDVIIYEYTDYLCFQCRKMHFYLRRLIESNPDSIRLVHVNYPLDHAYNDVLVSEANSHKGAGELALLSEYASDREDFWEINDSLYELGRTKGDIKYDRISELTGLSKDDVVTALYHNFFKKRLQIDIQTGLKKMVLGTPSYIIDGKIYEGIIPPEAFRKLGLE